MSYYKVERKGDECTNKKLQGRLVQFSKSQRKIFVFKHFVMNFSLAHYVVVELIIHVYF